jgi:hypothetical protein
MPRTFVFYISHLRMARSLLLDKRLKGFEARA